MADVTAEQILSGLLTTLDGLVQLVTVITYVSGIIMVVRGFMMFRALGQHITMASSRGEIAGPLVYVVVGSILLFLPSVLDVSFGTFFGSEGVTGIDVTAAEAQKLTNYIDDPENVALEQFGKVLLGYTKLIGLIAFVRGWHLISHAGQQGQQPGSITKGIIHLVGGIIAMNAIEVMNILARTIGYQNGIFS